ncbi:hypothetical protein BH24ACT5_BH24ACT5_02950 [soil metagenome]
MVPFARRILDTPTMMIVAEGDDLTLWDLEIDAFNQIPRTGKKFITLPHGRPVRGPVVQRSTSTYTCDVTTMSASEARAALPTILDRVVAGEEVTITRHGMPIAVVIRPDAMRVRRADGALAEAERVRELLERARSRALDSRPSLTAERADRLVDDVRRSRAGR